MALDLNRIIAGIADGVFVSEGRVLDMNDFKALVTSKPDEVYKSLLEFFAEDVDYSLDSFISNLATLILCLNHLLEIAKRIKPEEVEKTKKKLRSENLEKAREIAKKLVSDNTPKTPKPGTVSAPSKKPPVSPEELFICVRVLKAIFYNDEMPPKPVINLSKSRLLAKTDIAPESIESHVRRALEILVNLWNKRDSSDKTERLFLRLVEHIRNNHQQIEPTRVVNYLKTHDKSSDPVNV